MNSFHKVLAEDGRFNYENNLFYQKDLPRHNSFEESYLKLRQKECRVYTDDIVRLLPEFQGTLSLATEWNIRKRSADRLIRYLKRDNPKHIIEVGCGNGWLINYLHQHVAADYCGIDINETELQQAARISQHSLPACYLYGNILSGSMNELKADTIIVASAAQYFSHLESFVSQLFQLLTAKGEIHIIDTPFYQEEEITNAKKRSEKYFTEAGISTNQKFYYHHSWKSFGSLTYTITYQPHGIINKLKKIFIQDSPFPWITIQKNKNQ